jgi:hypothetical protein
LPLEINTDWAYNGLRVITIENSFLRVQILPEAGGKIWQIIYKPTGAALLWNNPRILPTRHAIHARYDDVWSGGWDELFPVDEEAVIRGERYPDHGELWTGAWKADTFKHRDEVGVVLEMQTPVSAMLVRKTIKLHPDSARIYFHHEFKNLGADDFPFLWKLHPALQVTAQHRIDFPAMNVIREPAFEGTLHHAPLAFKWPYAKTTTGTIDLRNIPSAEAKQLYFFYGTEMEAGWCALTNTATQLACGLSFDPDIFPSCWLFASYGGWRNYQVAVLEPCTGYPLNFEALVAQGHQRVLKPHQTLSTDVLFTVQEGLSCVANIDAQGVMR